MHQQQHVLPYQTKSENFYLDGAPIRERDLTCKALALDSPV